MNPNHVTGRVEFADDVALQAIEDAMSDLTAAEEEARYDTTRGEVLDHMSMHLTCDDDKVFMHALRKEDRQSIARVIDLIRRSYRLIVIEKTMVILERKARDRMELEDSRDGTY